MNGQLKPKEYDLLDALSQDSTSTQAGLASRLGMAVGSVNWYIKRLVKRGYVKVSHLDRTRLKYDLTPKGMSVFTERAMQYARDSLEVYKDFRQKAKKLVAALEKEGIDMVCLKGDDEVMDILRLTCIEAGLVVDESARVVLRYSGQEYQVIDE